MTEPNVAADRNGDRLTGVVEIKANPARQQPTALQILSSPTPVPTG